MPRVRPSPDISGNPTQYGLGRLGLIFSLEESKIWGGVDGTVFWYFVCVILCRFEAGQVLRLV